MNEDVKQFSYPVFEQLVASGLNAAEEDDSTNEVRQLIERLKNEMRLQVDSKRWFLVWRWWRSLDYICNHWTLCCPSIITTRGQLTKGSKARSSSFRRNGCVLVVLSSWIMSWCLCYSKFSSRDSTGKDSILNPVGWFCGIRWCTWWRSICPSRTLRDQQRCTSCWQWSGGWTWILHSRSFKFNLVRVCQELP